MIDWGTLSIMGTIAGVAFGGGIWLSGKFDEVKVSFREKLDEHAEHDNTRFNDLGLRLQKVELLTDPHGHFVQPTHWPTS